MRPHRRLVPSFFLLVILATGCSDKALSITGGAAPAPANVALDANHFETIYDGGGSVSFAGGALDFKPQTPASASDTHAVLIELKDTITTPVHDFQLVVDVTTVQQLRTPTPNPWEVFWLAFGYQGAVPVQKTSNYFIEKPGVGVELGLMQGEVGQQFLQTSSVSQLTVGQSNEYVYTRNGSNFTVTKDGTTVLNYGGSGAFPNRLYDGKGQIGFYCEDSEVRITAVKYVNLDSYDAPTVSSAVVPSIVSSPSSLQLPSSALLTDQGGVTTFSASNAASTGSLFWTCNSVQTNRTSIGSITSSSGSDCTTASSYQAQSDGALVASTITLDQSGKFTWIPNASQVGTYVFNFEGSGIGGGFSSTQRIVQVLPQWMASNQVFALDAQFSKAYSELGTQVYLERPSGTSDDNLDPWPSLVGSATAALNFTETAPWFGSGTSASPYSLHFNGAQTSLALDTNVLSGKPGVRVSMWVDPAAPTATTALFSNLSGGNGLEIRQASDGSGKIDVNYTNSGTTTCRSQTVLSAGTWALVTAQVSSTTLSLYINGNIECTASLSTALAAGAVAPVFGNSTSGSSAWSGSLSEAYLYARSDSSASSTNDQIAQDFLYSGNRYRSVPISGIISDNLVLHLDAAAATHGMSPPASATAAPWSNLASIPFTMTFYNFTGTSSSGWQLGTAAQTYLQFDGTDNSVILNTNSALSLGPQWTIEAWVQPGAALGSGNYKTVAETFDYNPGEGGYGLRIGATNTVDAFIVANTATDTVQGATALTAGTWYQIAATFNSSTGQLATWINGELSASKTSALSPTNGGNNPFFIGIPADYNASRHFNGGLAILRVYKAALTRAQLRQNCWAQKSRFTGVSCAN